MRWMLVLGVVGVLAIACSSTGQASAPPNSTETADTAPTTSTNAVTGSAIPIDGPDVVVVEFDGGDFACCGEGDDGSSGPVTAAVRASDTDRWETVRTPTAGPVAAVVAIGPFV